MQHYFFDYFNKTKNFLFTEISNNNTPENVYSVLSTFFDKMQYNLAQDITNEDIRNKVLALLNSSKSTCILICSADSSKITMDIYKKNNNNFASSFFTKYLNIILSLILTAYLYLEDKKYAAIFSLIISILGISTSIYTSNKTKNNLPEVQALPIINSQKMINNLSIIMSVLDTELNTLLEDYSFNTSKSILWSKQQFISLQMLLEALEQQDGNYALKSIPQLVSSLESQGIIINNYSKEKVNDFDMLPGVVEGFTIRPAIYYHDVLISRGQATFKTAINEVN